MEFHDFIIPIIREAGKIVIEGFYGTKHVESKDNQYYNVVTQFDKKVEEFLTQRIKQRYENHLIIGEETWPSGQSIKLTDASTWIIDPIDGTINFIKTVPMVGISVALAIKKEIVLGIVYNPITDQLFKAVKGEGAYLNEKRIFASKNQDLHLSVIGNELSLASIPFLRERTLVRVTALADYGVLGFRSFGCASLALCLVADGSLDVYFTDGLKCWDIAAGVFILQEAGGFASSPNGEPYDLFGRVLLTAGNKVLLQKMVNILTECDRKTDKKVDELMPKEIKEKLRNN